MEDRYDLILQPKTGTHHRHAMAALKRKELFDSGVGVGVCVTSDWRCFEEHPEKTVPVPRFAEMWCEMFGLDSDAQPNDLIEGANLNGSGYACIEVHQDPFVQMLYCIHNVCQPGAEGEWMDLRLNGVYMRRHFVEVESEDEDDVVTPPTVILEFVQKRVMEYDVRVLSDGTYELRGKSPYSLGDRFHGAWHGPFPPSAFPSMFPGQNLPTSFSYPNDI